MKLKNIIYKSKLFGLCLLVLLSTFCAIRFLDFTSLWHLMSVNNIKSIFLGIREIDGDPMRPSNLSANELKPIHTSVLYIEKGLSTYASSKKMLMDLAKNRKEKIIIVSYFDFFHPLIYLIYNKGKALEGNYLFSTIVDHIENGFTELIAYKSEIVSMNSKKGHESSIYYSLNDAFTRIEWQNNDRDNKNGPSLSIISGHGEMPYAKFVFFFYFYLPLIFLIYLAFKIDHSLFIASFYFFEMMILFPNEFFVKANFFLYETFGLMFLKSALFYIILSLFILLFCYGMFKKIKNRKIKENLVLKRVILAFFILLPFVLRF